MGLWGENEAPLPGSLLSGAGRLLLVAWLVGCACGSLPASGQQRDGVASLHDWMPILPHVQPVERIPRCSPDGRLWLIGDDHAVYRGRRLEGDESPWTWRRFTVPDGFQPFDVFPGAAGEAYVTGTWSVSGRTGLLRLEPREEDHVWVDLRPPVVGNMILDLDVTDDGTLWIGGEWREVLRLARGGRWEREVTPLPLHNVRIRMVDDEVGWIAAHAQQRIAVYRRQQGRWVVAARWDQEQPWRLQWVSREAAFLEYGGSLLEVRAPGATGATVVPRKVGRALGEVSYASPGRAHQIRDGRVFRLAGGAWQELGIANPRTMIRLADHLACGVLARDTAGWVFELRAVQRDEARDPLARWFTPPVLLQIDTPRVIGMTLVLAGGEEHVYVVDHLGPNVALPRSLLVPLSLDPRIRDPLWPESFRAVSDSLAVSGDDARSSWKALYDTAAVAGDLDGDGREELFVTSMYGHDTMLKGARDRHFVPWIEESASGGESADMTTGACLIDGDGDGDLDLYVTSVFAADRLLVNNGAGAFFDGTDASGMITEDASETPRCVDLDADGDTDVVVATWGRGLMIHENVSRAAGEPRFRTHRLLAGIDNPSTEAPLSKSSFNSVAAADLDGDGRPELFVASQAGCDLLLRNRGGMRFEDISDRLPRDQDCRRTLGAEFLDVDNDGDLDLALTGDGGLRIYENRRGRFVRERGEWQQSRRRWAGAGRTTGAIVADFDRDGDLDLLYGRDGEAVVKRENRTDNHHYIEVAVEGPASNRSAIGAVVRLYPAGHAGNDDALLGWQPIPPAGGYQSQGRRHAHFGGVEPGRPYDVVVSLPGARTRVVRVVPPAIERIVLASAGLSGVGPVWRARHFLGDRWNRRWSGGALLVAAALLGLAWLLFRGVPPRPAWIALGATVPLGLVLLVLSPFDPGRPSVIWALVVPGAAGILALVLVRARMVLRPLPEALVELDFALRAFRHNETPRRVLDRLLFVLENLAGEPVVPGSRRALLLREDLLAHREVVLPELTTIARLAAASSLRADEWSLEVRRQARLTARMLSRLRRSGRRAVTPDGAELATSLVAIERLAKTTRREIDERLSVDLAELLSLYVVSRKGLVPCTVEFVDLLPDGLRVRFMKHELFRVLDVLMENAVQAMAGSGDPRVAIRAEIASSRHARILFEDNGAGIPDGREEAIFEPGKTYRSGGSGFGLFYARRTLERFGGSIRALAAARGACFEVQFDVLAPAGRAVMVGEKTA